MQTRTVDYEDENLKVRLVVRDATALVGMKRSILIRDGVWWYQKRLAGESTNGAEPDEENKEGLPALEPVSADSLEGEAFALISQKLVPDLVSCVVEVEGLDMENLTPDDFMRLPDAFVDAWEQAVYELNPHWLGFPKLKAGQDPKEPEKPSSSELDES